ncbi:MAG: type IV secretion system protein [Cytophagales bacterium]|nr:type IV secretion system protein [Cytophagales bacterium]
MALEYASIAQQMYDKTVTLMSSKAGVLVGEGQDLALVLFLMSVTWLVLMWMLSGDGTQAMVESVTLTMKFSIVFSVMLLGWTSTVGGFFQSNTQEISMKVAGGSTVGAGVSNIISASKRLFVSDRQSLAINCSEVPTMDANGNPTGSTEVVCDHTSANGGASVGLVDILMNFPAVLFTWLLRLLALGFMILLLFAFLAVNFIAEVSFGAAMTFGPILVPWILIQRTEFLFDGWLRFTIIACFIKMVSAWMLSIVLIIIDGVKQVAEQVVGTSGTDLIAADEMAAFFVCVFAALAAFLMWQAPSFAAGLVSGSGGATAQKFGKGSAGGAANSGFKNLIEFAKANRKDSK